mmetsp:Transcript_9624/g.20303  ORF Transcript_9624/g.20303 Transcript_9624/m.20303 type:complete len:115 (+) Transcript_9624:864-1208(+)
MAEVCAINFRVKHSQATLDLNECVAAVENAPCPQLISPRPTKTAATTAAATAKTTKTTATSENESRRALHTCCSSRTTYTRIGGSAAQRQKQHQCLWKSKLCVIFEDEEERDSR